MPQLTLHLLGSFQALLDGISITSFETHKVRALLAYLAVEADRPHSRDELVGLLWPDQPDPAARASLRQDLANQRKAIGERTIESPFLDITSDTIQFRHSSSCWIDGLFRLERDYCPNAIRICKRKLSKFRYPKARRFSNLIFKLTPSAKPLLCRPSK